MRSAWALQFCHFVALSFAADNEFGVWKAFDDGGHAFDKRKEPFPCVETPHGDDG